MGLIQLSKPGVFAVVDDADHATIDQYLWCPQKNYRTTYAAAVVNGRKVKMHRLLMPQTQMVDHINGDGLDNRRCNLRPATPLENSRNATKRKNATSQFKGVSWNTRKRKWFVQICVNYKDICLGYFADEIAAARAYDVAARKHFGEFARLNFAQEAA